MEIKWGIFIYFPFLCALSGENLVSEPQSQREETDQEEAGSVWRQRGVRAQRPGFGEPSAGAGVSQSHRHPRLSVPSSGNEHLAIYQEYTASDCDSVKQLTSGPPNKTEHSDTRTGHLMGSQRIWTHVLKHKAVDKDLIYSNEMLEALEILLFYRIVLITWGFKKKRKNRRVSNLKALNCLWVNKI